MLGYFMVTIWKRYGQKLRKIIRLHLGLLTFLRFHYGRTLKPFIFMDFGFSDVSLRPKTNIIYLWRHQDTPKSTRKYHIIFKNIISGNSTTFELHPFEVFWKRRAPKHLDDPSNKFLKILDMGSISSRKSEIEFW